MKKIVFLLMLVSIFQVLSAQEQVSELEGCFSSSKTSNKESFAVPNQIEDEMMLLFEERSFFKAKLLNPDYTEQSAITGKIVPRKYKSIIGYNIEGKNYKLFYTNATNKKFAVQTLDFNTKTATVTELGFKLKKERYVESINYNNKIHLITITKYGNDLNIYTFDNKHQHTKKTISLSSLRFPPSYRASSVYDGLIYSSYGTLGFAKIENQNPNVIETTSASNKMYLLDNKLVISFDVYEKMTQILKIDLDTYEVEKEIFDQPAKSEEGYSKSNSYIFENKLFQITSSRAKMKFKVVDMDSKELIKEYGVTKEDTITFKNSPIIQEGGGMFPALSENRVREMEKTAKYLRKISSADLGISVYKTDDSYNVILGGTKEINTGGGAPMMMPGFGGALGGAAIASFGAVTMSFNPTFMGYNSYTATKSTYINCLFDVDFEHIEGEIQDNRYDRLNDFENGLFRPKAINVFLHKNVLHYSYLDHSTQKYTIVTFN